MNTQVPFKPRTTQAYSFVGESRITVPSKTKDVVINETLDIKTIVSMLIEKHVEAWKSLPEQVKNLMLTSPWKFKLISDGASSPNGEVYIYAPKIAYNGMVFQYNKAGAGWILNTIDE